MHIVLMTRSAGNERALSPYVRLHFGAYSPDRSRYIQLPPLVYTLWVVLTDHPNEVVSYLDLTQALWPQSLAAEPDLVRDHVGRLRKLLVMVGWPAGCLYVVRDQGVEFRPPRA